MSSWHWTGFCLLKTLEEPEVDYEHTDTSAQWRTEIAGEQGGRGCIFLRTLHTENSTKKSCNQVEEPNDRKVLLFIYLRGFFYLRERNGVVEQRTDWPTTRHSLWSKPTLMRDSPRSLGTRQSKFKIWYEGRVRLCVWTVVVDPLEKLLLFT